ncbi:glycosyltransferase 87 family protein [Corynebacterium mastitidis]|uniref:glycosyltransferase 87 family protein n=1 Tax=Corynebacterium mastitidis TaxID=161890 RepID=UPI00254B948A|nr:glycosyltransferase 87 family protein [Corynebacterium mastitidis]MDK8451534.1 glycosyltransferase 87 family protein [Corynebacterium mastitidis]
MPDSPSVSPSVDGPVDGLADRPADRVAPAHTEPLAAGVIERLGGPTGRFGSVGTQRWWTPLRVLIALGMTFLSLGYLSKANCLVSATGEGGRATLNWSGNRQYMSACYSDVVGQYGARHLERVSNPFAERQVDGPVLTGLFQWALNALAHLTEPLVRALPFPVAPAAWYFMLTALVLGCVWIVTLRLLLDLVGPRVWDLVLVAASPLLIVYAFHAWDLLAVAALVAALHALRRARSGLAGLWIGLGAALQVWPVLLLAALALVAARGGGAGNPVRWSSVRRVGGAAAAAWVAVNAPVLLAYPQAWADFYRAAAGRNADWGTLYYLVGEDLGVSFSPAALNVLVPILWAVGLVAVAQWVAGAARTPRLAEMLFLLVALTLLVGKAWLPQHALWLLVPAVLALPRWRWLLAWMLAEFAVFPATMLYSGAEEGNGVPLWFFSAVILARGGILTALAVMVAQQGRGRREDAVRAAAAGGRDPLLPPPGGLARTPEAGR